MGIINKALFGQYRVSHFKFFNRDKLIYCFDKGEEFENVRYLRLFLLGNNKIK